MKMPGSPCAKPHTPSFSCHLTFCALIVRAWGWRGVVLRSQETVYLHHTRQADRHFPPSIYNAVREFDCENDAVCLLSSWRPCGYSAEWLTRKEGTAAVFRHKGSRMAGAPPEAPTLVSLLAKFYAWRARTSNFLFPNHSKKRRIIWDASSPGLPI